MISFKQFLMEKLSISQYRDIYKKIDKSYGDKNKSEFGGKWRIYLPVENPDVGAEKINIPSSVQAFITTQKLEVINYLDGTVKKENDKRIFKLGKLLNASGEDKTLKDYNESKNKIKNTKQNKTVVVLSRHPYDIAGMSTDRSWQSCKNLISGINKHYIAGEIDKGVLVAYWVNENDLNINQPIGRVLVLPYVNKENKNDVVYMIAKRYYGTFNKEAMNTLKKWLKKTYKDFEDNSDYYLDDDIYDDVQGRIITTKKWYSDYIDKYGIKNGILKIQGDVNISNTNLLTLE